MHLNTAIVVDDLAADRKLAAHVLRAAGWSVQLARTTTEAMVLMEQIGEAEAVHTLVLTDLFMPHDL